jgi:U3 small nucleolar RNA-associated protein 12
LSCDNSNYPYKLSSEVSVLERSPDKATLAAGYVDGSIRIFNYINRSLVATLKGHRSQVNTLCFTDDGMNLASGGSDCEIVIWDLVSNTGVSRLKGHKDAVTSLVFMHRSSQSYLVSVSKDTLMKVFSFYII